MTLRTPRSRTTSFGPLMVEYDDRVLRPRAWTLLQSRWAAELARDAPGGPLLELCAGAGQIGLAAAVLAGRNLVQIEADPVAAWYASANAQRAGWAQRTEIRVGLISQTIADAERFALILADPPYLDSDSVSRWPDDPVSAVDGGPDGLRLIGECLTVARNHLTSEGRMLLQVAGAGQADRVRDELAPNLRCAATRAVDQHGAIMLLERRP